MKNLIFNVLKLSCIFFAVPLAYASGDDVNASLADQTIIKLTVVSKVPLTENRMVGLVDLEGGCKYVAETKKDSQEERANGLIALDKWVLVFSARVCVDSISGYATTFDFNRVVTLAKVPTDAYPQIVPAGAEINIYN
jgi:hypothetical protein